jgi:hypothetical protein
LDDKQTIVKLDKQYCVNGKKLANNLKIRGRKKGTNLWSENKKVIQVKDQRKIWAIAELE